MTSPLTSFVTITFVATADTPPEHQPLDGKTFQFPPEYLATLGSGPGQPGKIGGVRGYHAEPSAGVHQWMMTGEITAAQKTAILNIPGGLGWIDQSFATGTPLRVTYNQMRRMVGEFNVPGPDVLDMTNKIHDAAVANRNAQIAAGG